MELAIYGAGGFAREVAWLAETCNSDDHPIQLVGFIDDNPINQGQILNDIPVISLEQTVSRFPKAYVVGGIGTSATRQKTLEKALNAGLPLGSLIHPRVERSKWIEYGKGIVICAGCILTTNISLGNSVQINLDCTIGHDVILDDYVTLAPGVHISGCVHLGKRVYVGTGAVIINGTQNDFITIEDDVTVGAGACVTKNVAAGLTVVGIPAKPLLKG